MAALQGPQRRGRPRKARGQPREMMNKVKAVMDHLPDFLVHVNKQTGGKLMERQSLLRDEVRACWAAFAQGREIVMPNGVPARLAPSNVCYALIRNYSPSGPRPRAMVDDTNIIYLGERALEVLRDGFDRRRELLKAQIDIRSRSHDLIADKGGVTISVQNWNCREGNVTVGSVRLDQPLFQMPEVVFTVVNSSLRDVWLMSSYLLFERHGFVIEARRPAPRVMLKPAGTHNVKVRCVPDQIGVRRDWCVFEFQTTGDGTAFSIVRFLSVRFTDSVTEDPALQASKPFVPKPVKVLRAKEDDVVDGIRAEKPPKSKLNTDANPLGNYNDAMVHKQIWPGLWITKYLRTGRDAKKPLNSQHKRLLEQRLSPDNYMQKFLLMLLLEHRQEEVDIHNYDMVSAEFVPNAMYLRLKVPGLAENRPSLLLNDHLLARKPGDSKRYRGYVHNVEVDDVLLKFDRTFHESHIKGHKFEIDFTINPTQWWSKNRAMIHSVTALSGDLLFPNERCLEVCDVPRITRFYDKKLDTNPEQAQAVSHIVAGSSGRAPYLIFGPPGTGKTTTVVEAIKQVVLAKPGCRILACTPSNSAADLVTSRLIPHISRKDVLRLNALSRQKSSILEDNVSDVSCSEGGLFYFPDLPEIKSKRVVTCTLVTAGRLVSAGMPADHFTHIFVDECGHAIEAESMIPLSLLCVPGKTQVVLAGDPHQLGPIVRSTHALKGGLAMSLLERLMKKCELYQRQVTSFGDGYDVRAVTKLLQNYRSHPSIILVPNSLFYDDELQVCADQGMREMLCNWEHLPAEAKKQKFPIIFDGVEGEDEREDSSPSFFNRDEISRVRLYVENLRSCRKPRIPADHIGVISPYHKQVTKIRTLLHAKNHGAVKVGSVEEFQGQEKTVIIISTVRSSAVHLEMDKNFDMGFLRNPKRFNVAITRAMALLIVIGNPYILAQDDHWREFLDYCVENGGYTGCAYRPEDVDVARLKLEAMELNGSTAAYGEDVDLRDDPGWKREE